jgi:hypothetical protein
MTKEVTRWCERIQDRPIFGDFIYEDALVIDPRQSRAKATGQPRHAPKLSREVKPHSRPIVRGSRLTAGDAVVVWKPEKVHHGQGYPGSLDDCKAGELIQASDDQRVFNGQLKEGFRQPFSPSLIGLVAGIAENMHIIGKLEGMARGDLQQSGAWRSVIPRDIASALPNVPCVLVLVRVKPDDFRAPPALAVTQEPFIVGVFSAGFTVGNDPARMRFKVKSNCGRRSRAAAKPSNAAAVRHEPSPVSSPVDAEPLDYAPIIARKSRGVKYIIPFRNIAGFFGAT